MGRHRRSVLGFLALSLSASACSPAALRASRSDAWPSRVTVTHYRSLPAESPSDVASFTLDPGELAAFRRALPPLDDAEVHAELCGVPDFHFEMEGSEGQTVSGHFFHGPDRLFLSAEGEGYLLTGQAQVYEVVRGAVDRRRSMR